MKLKFLSFLAILLFGFTAIFGQPSSVSPTDTQADVSVTTDVTWQSFVDGTGSPDAGLYTLKFYTDGTHGTQLGSSITGIASGGVNTTVSNATILTALSLVGGLDHSATYYWGVQDEDDAVEYFYSFTTIAPTVTLIVDNANIDEDGAPFATFTATLSGKSALNVTVDLAINGSSTAAGGDYNFAGDPITINAGNTTGTATVTAIQDTKDEFDETVVVDINNVTNGTESGSQQATTTILDDDDPPTVTLAVDNANIEEDGAPFATFTATLSTESGKDVTVDLAINGSSTAAGGDYNFAGDPITINAGNTTGTATVTAIQDTKDEFDETVVVDINSVTNGTESGSQQATTTILDDDDPPTVTLAVNNANIDEDGAPFATFTATLSTESGKDVTVDLDFTGTAVGGGTDYTIGGVEPIVITAGGLTGAVTVTSDQDNLLEGDESVIVDIGSVTNGTESGVQQQTTTIDDDEYVELTLNNATINAENGGTATFTASVKKEDGSAGSVANGAVTVNFAWAGDAIAADYSPQTASIAITNPATSGGVQVTANRDNPTRLLEGDETIQATITLDAPYAGLLGTATQTTTIKDEDRVEFVAASSTAAEEAGASTFKAEVANSGKVATGTGITFTVGWGGTATGGGADYSFADNLTITDGSSESTNGITLTVATDDILEGPETAIATITNTSEGAYVIGAQAAHTVTITDNEKVTATAPSGGVNYLNPDFQWNLMTDATNYSLEVRDNGTDALVFQNTTLGNVDHYQPASYSTPLEDNKSYKWRVQANNASGTSDWSDYLIITTTQQTLTSPGNGDAGVQLNGSAQLVFDWADVTGADQYYLEYDDDPWNSPTTETVAASQSSLQTLAYNTDYSWRVTARNTRSIVQTFTTELDPNAINIDSQPAATVAFDTTGLSIQFDYDAAGGDSPANIYVKLNGNPVVNGGNNGQFLNVSSDLNNQVVDLGDLLNNTSYAITIVVVNVDEGSDTYTVTGNTFTTKLARPAVTLIANGATGQDLNPKFTWVAVAGANNYMLEINDASDFGGDVIYNADVGNVLEYTVNSPAIPLVDNGTYYWRLTAKHTGTGNYSLASTKRSFTTTQQTLDSPADNSFGIQLVTGNPNSPEMTVSWNSLAGSGADNYLLKVGTTSGGGQVENDANMGTDLSHTIGPLAYNTRYYWSVTGRNIRAVERDFVTELAPLENISTPAAGKDRPITNTIAFDYKTAGDVSDADVLIRYRVKTSAAGAFGAWTNLINATYSADVNFSENFTVTYNTDVEWEYKVTNHDEASDFQSGNGAFRTLLANPVLVTPPHTPPNYYKTTDRTPDISFTQAASSSDVRFDFDYSYIGTGTPSPASQIEGVSSGACPWGAVDQPLGRYTWNIEANDIAGSGNGTNTLKLSSNGPFIFDIIPDLMTPVNGLTGVPILPYVTWDDGGVDDYIIDIATDAGFTNFVVQKAVHAPTEVYQFLEWDTGMPLSNNTKYYWRVRYTNSGIDFTSVEWHFTTVPAINVILNHPANGSTVQTTTTDFTWEIDQSTGSMKYYTQVRDTSGLPVGNDWHPNLLDFSEIGTNLESTFTLLGGHKYYWRVVVLNSSGAVAGGATSGVIDYSPVYYFNTAGGAVNAPVQSYPSNAATIYTETPQFTWYLGNGETGVDLTYDIQVDNDGTPGGELIGQENVTSMNYTAGSGILFAGNTYYWRVRSIYKRGGGAGVEDSSSYTAYRSFTIAGGSSVTLVPSWPVGGVLVYTNAPKLYWYLGGYGPNTSALKYQVKYSTSSAMTGSELTNGTKLPTDGNIVAQGTSDLFKQLPTLPVGTPHYWQVRAYYNGNWGAWSNVASFTTNGSGTLVVPIPSYPTGGVTIYTLAPKLYWYLEASGDGLTYDIQYNTTGTFANNTPDVDNLATLYYQMPNLTAGTTYYWRVRSDNDAAATENAGNESAWSSIVSFSITGSTSASYPVATWPVSNPTVYSNRPTLNWYLEGSSIGITGYEVKYSTTDQAAGAGWGAFNHAGA